jgi:hypothetical protein
MDPWLLNIFDRSKSARTVGELQAILDDLQDQYDASSGPGLEGGERLVDAIRRRLFGMQS